MARLSELFTKYGSDKCTHHAYTDIYDSLGESFGDHALDILEIGVQYGGSLMALKDFWPKAKITGIDIEDTRKWKRPDVEFIITDVNTYKPDRSFDLIIDDGSHLYKDQLYTALNLSEYLKPAGVLLIEDVDKTVALSLQKSLSQLVGKYAVTWIDLTRKKGNDDDYLISIQKYGTNA